MLKNRDFVVTGLQPWDIEIGSNAKNIALEISRHNRVLYVNTPFDFLSFRSDRQKEEARYRTAVVRRQAAPLRRINENLWVLDFPFTVFPANRLPARLFTPVNYYNNRKICRYIRHFLDKLGFTSVIHFNDNDLYRSFYAKEFLRPAISVYYRRDNLLGVGYWKRHGTRLEPLLVAKSDLVLTNSQQLADAVSSYNTEVYNVGQGVDLSAFNPDFPYPVPEDMKAIPRPVIGYAGFLTGLRLDAALIDTLARQLPHCSFVLVGPEDEVFRNHPLRKSDNVWLLGNKKNDRIPEYIAAFDVCINPQLVNDTTAGNYPRKVDEYLALGKPVVATDTPAMRFFGEHVYLCRNAGDYCENIGKALAGKDDPELRKSRAAFAGGHTWQAGVEKIYDHMACVLNKKENHKC